MAEDTLNASLDFVSAGKAGCDLGLHRKSKAERVDFDSAFLYCGKQ